MFVKLNTVVGEHKSGDIVDVDEAIGRAYVAAGHAVESSEAARSDAEFEKRLATATQSIKDELMEQMRAVNAGVKGKGPPGGKVKFGADGVEFDGSVDHTESPADRDVNGRAVRGGLGEIIGLIGRMHPRVPSAEREHADSRLTQFYKLDRIADFHTTDLASVSRAGTESMSGGTGYGYLIKPEYLAGYFEVAMEDSIFAPFCRQLPVGATNEIKWPALNQFFQPAIGQTAAAAGVRVFRKGEITQRQAIDASLKEITFKIEDLTGFTSFSRDLIQDNYISAVAIVQDMFLRAMAYTVDFESINSSSAGKLIGVRNSPALLTATRANANTIRLGDLQAMMAVFHQASYRRSMFLAHQSCYTELLTIKYGASGVPAFIPNASIDQSSPFSAIEGTSETGDMKFASHGTLLGKPIRFTTDKLEQLGTVGDIMLVDPYMYGIATRQGVEVGVSEHFNFDTDQISYRFKMRNAGQSLWTGPYHSTTPSGADYKTSPFVQLSAGS